MSMSQRENAACLKDVERVLCHVLENSIIEGLQSIHQQAIEITHNEMSSVDVFRMLLGDIRSWSQTLLDEEVQRITSSRIPYLQKMLTALFVLKVKVLSCLNLRENNEDFALSIPSNATFLHQVYIQTANVLTQNPRVMQTMDVLDLRPIVRDGITKATYECINWDELLKWALEGVSINDLVKKLGAADEDVRPSSAEAEMVNATAMEKRGTEDDDEDENIDEEGEERDDAMGRHDNHNVLDHPPPPPSPPDAAPYTQHFDDNSEDDGDQPLFDRSLPRPPPLPPPPPPPTPPSPPPPHHASDDEDVTFFRAAPTPT